MEDEQRLCSRAAEVAEHFRGNEDVAAVGCQLERRDVVVHKGAGDEPMQRQTHPYHEGTPYLARKPVRDSWHAQHGVKSEMLVQPRTNFVPAVAIDSVSN